MDHDWDNFKLMFEELHGDFFARLKADYPELGNAELRLCALLRPQHEFEGILKNFRHISR